MPASRTEQLARDLVTHYLPFLEVRYNTRPNWLRYPKTGRNLELDIHFPHINLVLEIQGIQHSRPIIGMHRDHAAFLDQLARDTFKAERCKERESELIPLTIFDLNELRFTATMRRIFQAADRATMDNPNLSWKIKQARQRFERGDDYPALRPLFHEAERLSRQKFKPPKPKKVSWWRRLFSFGSSVPFPGRSARRG